MTVGESLRNIREMRGLSMQDVVEKTGISNATLNRYEHDKNYPTLFNLILLADTYKVTLDRLVGRVSQQVDKFDLEQLSNFANMLTPKDVADILGVDKRTVQSWCTRGIIEAKMLRHKYYIHPKTVEWFRLKYRIKKQGNTKILEII